MTDKELEERRQRYYALLQEDEEDPEVQYQLACCYLDGDGAAPDREKGLRWLAMAAENGHGEAAARLEKEGRTGGEAEEEPAPAAEKPAEELPPLTRATLPQWLARAEEGDSRALREVARFGIHNHTSSPAECRNYLERAARQGNRDAWNDLGYFYDRGALPLPQGEDRAKLAYTCYQNAAELGSPAAMGNLAYCYFAGHGVAKDEAQSAFWREKQSIAAMEAGSPAFCEVAGLDFRYGVFTPQSISKSILCFQRLLSGDAASVQRGKFRLAEDAWSASQTPEEAQRLLLPLAEEGNPWAEEILMILAGAGVLPGLRSRYHGEAGDALLERLRQENCLSVFGSGEAREAFLRGFLGPEEERESPDARNRTLLQLWERSAWNGVLDARSTIPCCYILRVLLSLAVDLPPLSKDTLVLWRLRANAGDAETQYRLAVRGLEQKLLSPEDARKFLEMACRQDYDGAWNQLGYWYDTGKLPCPGGDAKAKAVECYRKGAEAGDYVAMSNLANYCFLGTGTSKDPEESAYWRKRQAEVAVLDDPGGYDWCERAGLDFFYGVYTPASRENALACFRQLEGTSRAGEVRFRELELQWDLQTGLEGALALLIPLADQKNQGNLRAETTLAVLYAAGADQSPALRNRYQGPEGEERLSRVRLWGGPAGAFFPDATFRLQFFSSFPHVEPQRLEQLAGNAVYSASHRSPSTCNLFWAKCLPPLLERGGPGAGKGGSAAQDIAGGITKLKRGLASILDPLGK